MINTLNAEKLKFANLTSDLKLTGKVLDDEGYKIAIRRAILDLTVRTLRPKCTDASEKLKTGLLDENNPNSFFNQLKQYFTLTGISEEDFDNWHRERCEDVLVEIQKYYTNGDSTPVHYGKAQKIVNITFKGCYCLEGADQKEDLFKHCHMPLDSFTLEWFYREVVTKWWNKQNQVGRDNRINKTQLNSWSNIDYLDANIGNSTVSRIERYKDDNLTRIINGFYHYVFIQDIIRAFFSEPAPGTSEQVKHRGRTVLQTEFFIWPEIQLHLSAEALFGQSIGEEEIFCKLKEMLSRKHQAEIARKELELVKAREKGLKKATYIEQEIIRLKGGKDMAAAREIYRDMPLSDKISLLAEKIDFLLRYCNIGESN